MPRPKVITPVYDMTICYEAPASDNETDEDGLIESETELNRSMAERWCETTYATVLRQNIHQTHKSVHNTVPVVKTVKLNTIKSNLNACKNGLMRSQLEIQVKNVIPKIFCPVFFDNFDELTAGRENQKFLTEQQKGVSSSSETIFSDDTFVPKQPTRTYVDGVSQGSVQDVKQQNLTVSTQCSPEQEREIHIEQTPRIIPLTRESPSSPADSGRITLSTDSQCTEEPAGQSPQGVLHSGESESSNAAVPISIERQQSESIPFYSNRRQKRPLSLISTAKRYDKSRCFECQKIVYPFEGIHVMDRVFHKTCFRCQKCQRMLSVRTFNVGNGKPYCEPHYNELFRVRGRLSRVNESEDLDDFLLHQIAIQSSTPSETPRERPPPLVTQKLVAKFQQMATFSRSSQDVRKESRLTIRPLSISPDNTPRENRRRSLFVGNNPVPTPFLQATTLPTQNGSDENTH